MTKGKKAFPLQHDGVGKQKSTETKIVIKKYSIDSSYSAEGGKSIPNQTKVAPKKASPKNRIKKEDSLFTEPTLDSINVDCPVKLNKILPQSTITCRHIPAQGQLLRMYHAVARAIHWSQETRKFSSNCRDCSISPLNSWSPIYACLQCVNFSCLQISFSPSIHSKTTEARKYFLYMSFLTR